MLEALIALLLGVGGAAGVLANPATDTPTNPSATQAAPSDTQAAQRVAVAPVQAVQKAPTERPEATPRAMPTTGRFDYQLGLAYDVLPDGHRLGPGDVVVRDASMRPVRGAYNVCYVNGFQTQPDEKSAWATRTSLLAKDSSGRPLKDEDWPDEYVLSPNTATQREGILKVMRPQITACAKKGFDAVEIDNLDTFRRYEGTVSSTGSQALAREYVKTAHSLGLAIGQKNAAEVARTHGKNLGFDFAVAEECFAWGECAEYTSAYGRRVVNIEYPDSLREAGKTFAQACAAEGRPSRTILRDRELVKTGQPVYRFEACR